MLKAKIGGAIVLGIIGTSLIAYAVPITPVAIVGHPAPGIGGNYNSIYNITINDAGLVTTKASAPGSFSGGFWIGTPANLQLFLHDGAAAPRMPAGTIVNDVFKGIEIPITNDGQVAFAANLQGPQFPDIFYNGALWAGPVTAPALVAYVGSPAHGIPGATYNYSLGFEFPSFAAGRVLYVNQLAGDAITESNKYGMWEGPIDAPELIFRSPQHAPGTPDGVNFGDFWGVWLNSAGQIAFGNSLTGPTVNGNSYSLWAGSRTAPQLIFRAGLPAPGTPDGVQFSEGAQYGPNAGLGRSNGWHFNERGEVLFYSFLKGPGLDETNDSGIFAGAPDTLELIARVGSHAPGTASGVNFSKSIDNAPNGGYLLNFDDLKQNNLGTIAFKGQVTGPGITPANDEGLWSGKAGSIHLFVMEGDQAPGMSPGVVFSRIQNGGSIMTPFTLLRLTDTDQIAFVTGVAGPGVATSNQIGLFASDANGNLGLIARSGDFMDVGNGELRQITQLWPDTFNSRNQLTFLAFFTDGTNGAFVATVPEPSIALLVLGLGFIVRQRRP